LCEKIAVIAEFVSDLESKEHIQNTAIRTNLLWNHATEAATPISIFRQRGNILRDLLVFKGLIGILSQKVPPLVHTRYSIKIQKLRTSRITDTLKFNNLTTIELQKWCKNLDCEALDDHQTPPAQISWQEGKHHT
jgi:DNA-binding Xre family transcriptional regulator